MPRRSKSRRIARRMIVYAEIAAIIGLIAGVIGLMFLAMVMLFEVL